MRGIKLKLSKYLPIIILIIILVAPRSFAQSNKESLKADRIQYYSDEELIKAYGNAQISLDDMVIYADRIDIDLSANKLRAFGMVKVKGGEGEFNSDELEYDIKTKEGIFIESDGIFISEHSKEPIRINSPLIENSQDKSEFSDLTFTTCDLKESHYNFRARSMKVYPGDKIVAYHMSLWEFSGRIPIFYFPYIIYSLDEDDDEQPIDTEVGYSRSRGWFIRNTYTYNLDREYDNLLLKPLGGGIGQLYLDYYTESRFAGGFKHYYRTLEDDNAYLYLFAEEDKRDPDKDFSLNIKVERELEEDNLERDYTIEYKNHQGDYFSNPIEDDYTLEVDFSQKTGFDIGDNKVDLSYTKDRSYDKKVGLDFEQSLELDKWDNKFELSYNKDNTYQNRYELSSVFDRKNSNRLDIVRLGFDYEFQEKVDETLFDEYNLDLHLRKMLSNESANRDDDIRLRLDYDSINPFKGEGDQYGEYNAKIDYRNYLSNNLDFGYKYHYDDYYSNRRDDSLDSTYDTAFDINYNNLGLEYTYEYKDYDFEERSDDLDWDYDTSLKLDYSKSGYKLDVETRLEKTNLGLDYYYLPKVDLELDMGRISNKSYLRPLDIKFGGFNKYQDDWDERRQYGYYNLRYRDNKDISSRNNINYTQTVQQNFYSTGHFNWWHRSSLRLRSSILENWRNELNHTYQQVEGEVPGGFGETLKSEENKVTEELKWSRGKSDFYIKTGYDFIGEEFDRLESELNYEVNDNYDAEAVLSYDLNQRHFEDFGAKLLVNYEDFELSTGIIIGFRSGEVDRLRFNNDLDWTFGEEEWEWTINLASSYDDKEGRFTRANIALEKMLHCRKVSFAYDHIKDGGEFSFRYQILAFPQGEFRFGSGDDDGMLSDIDLGGILDGEE